MGPDCERRLARGPGHRTFTLMPGIFTAIALLLPGSITVLAILGPHARSLRLLLWAVPTMVAVPVAALAIAALVSSGASAWLKPLPQCSHHIRR